jgi:hypothetical protein
MMAELSASKLTREISRLYVCVFVTSLGAGMYTYFIPVFAQNLGASFFNLGLIGGGYSITYAVAGIVAQSANAHWAFALMSVFAALMFLSVRL